MIVYALLGLYIILQGFDIYTTWKAITEGKGRERNKVVAWVLDKLGVLPGLIIFKTPMIGLIFFALEWSYLPHALVVLCLIYGWIGWSNYKVITRA